MREHFVGRSSRLTAYFCGLALGLALLVAGLAAARSLVLGDVSPTVSRSVAAVGLLGGLLLAYVAGYLNGSLLASWVAGFVPAAGLVGTPIADGSLRDIGLAFVGAFGVGVLVGTVGFVIAVEKHRLDARTADLPTPASRIELLQLVVVSVLVGVSLAVGPLYV